MDIDFKGRLGMSDNDRFVTVSHQGFFSRLGNAIVGVFVGLLLVAIGFGVLFWNEGRAVKQAQNLAQGLAAAVDAPMDKRNPENEGRLVHVSGEAKPVGQVQDKVFGITGDYLRLERRVEMYQWEEHTDRHTTKDLGGGSTTTTTYTYRKEWRPKLIDSKEFKEPKGHENPGVMKYTGMTFNAPEVKVGAYALSAGLLEQLPTQTPVTVDKRTLDKVAPGLREQIKLDLNGYFIGKDRAKVEIGDMKVTFAAAMPRGVSVMGKQAGGKIEAYQTPVGGTIELLKVGSLSSAAMIKEEVTLNERNTWLIRVGGFFVLVIGFAMSLRPLSVVMDVIPFLGSLVEAGVIFAAVGMAVLVSSVAVAMGWVFYRPVIGVPILVVAAGAGVWLFMMGRRSGVRS
jgi:hypothetical protein